MSQRLYGQLTGYLSDCVERRVYILSVNLMGTMVKAGCSEFRLKNAQSAMCA